MEITNEFGKADNPFIAIGNTMFHKFELRAWRVENRALVIWVEGPEGEEPIEIRISPKTCRRMLTPQERDLLRGAISTPLSGLGQVRVWRVIIPECSHCGKRMCPCNGADGDVFLMMDQSIINLLDSKLAEAIY